MTCDRAEVISPNPRGFVPGVFLLIFVAVMRVQTPFLLRHTDIMKTAAVLALCLLLGAFVSAEFYPFPGLWPLALPWQFVGTR